MDVYQVINSRIMELLEQGTVPWRKTWNAQSNYPRNLLSGKKYQGINVFMLACQQYSSPWWLTFKQVQDKGGHVVKGSKSSPVIFWKWLDKKDSIPGVGREEPINGKIPLLRYPALSLADARQRRDDAKKLLSNDIDPGEMKKSIKQAKVALEENSFEIIAREWHLKFSPTWSDSHAYWVLRRLEQYVFPVIGLRPIADIKGSDVLKVLQIIEAVALETAHRVKFVIGQIFRYAVGSGKAERDWTADLKGLLPPRSQKHHAAITDPKEVAGLLRAIDNFTGTYTVKCALQLAPLVFLRPGELRNAEWSEFDLDSSEWNFPVERLKLKKRIKEDRKGEKHLVPLSHQAVKILIGLHALTGTGKYVFPCARSNARPMSNMATNAGLARMGYKGEMTSHGFRAMARTILDEVLQQRVDLIEHQLAHSVRDANGRAYNRTAHLVERKKMMQVWADYLDGLKAGAKVIPFEREAA